MFRWCSSRVQVVSRSLRNLEKLQWNIWLISCFPFKSISAQTFSLELTCGSESRCIFVGVRVWLKFSRWFLSDTSLTGSLFVFLTQSFLVFHVLCSFFSWPILQKKSYGHVMISSFLYLYCCQWFLSALSISSQLSSLYRSHLLSYFTFWRVKQ